MRAKDFLQDDKDNWAGGGTEFEPSWNQEIGVDGGQGYQRASGNLPGGVNLSLAADAPGQMSTFTPQRGVNIAKGPASLYLGDQGSVSGSYNIPVGQDSSVSLSAAGQRDQGIQNMGLQYQRGGFTAGVNKGTQPGATPQVNVGYSAQFEEDVDEGKIISDRELVDVYLKGKHYDQIIQKKVAEGIPNRLVHAFIDKVAKKFGLNPTAFIYGPSKEGIVDESSSLHKSNEGGTLEGYVVDTDKPNLDNYLQSQGADSSLISAIVNKYKKIGIIRNMYVDPNQRGQGYGNSLIGDAIDNAAGLGAEAIILVADSQEENSMNLVEWYEGFGFEVIGNAAGDPVMILDLQ